MPIEEKRKLMVRDLGNPKDVTKISGKNAATGETVYLHPGRMVIGTILGVVTKIRMVVTGNGDEVETLMGNFRGLDHEGNIKIEATSLGLPSAWMTIVTDPFYSSGEMPVEFAIEIGTIRTDAGWTWSLNPIFKPVNVDPLVKLLSICARYYSSESIPEQPDETKEEPSETEEQPTIYDPPADPAPDPLSAENETEKKGRKKAA